MVDERTVLMDVYHFDVVDYAVFASMLILSVLTGLYYGCRNKYCNNKEGQTLAEYLTGNKNLRPFPVALSLIARLHSFWKNLLPHWPLCFFFFYLELRFNRVVRTIISVFFVLDEVMFLPIVIYVPSLAFNQVTGINIHVIGTIVCIVCVFYTLLRYLSLPNEKQSKLSVLLFTIGVSFFVWICCYAGILVYATYYGCDPLSLGRIQADDQILPLFVMETVGHLRGVPGLFYRGSFWSSVKSYSLSVVLNSTAQVFLEDFIKGCMRLTLTEKTSTLIVKSVVLVLGTVAVGFLYVVEHMGGVLEEKPTRKPWILELISPVMQWVLPAESQRYAGSAIRKARNREIVENEKMVQGDIRISAIANK
ncbi:hypothetical protein NQ317_008850, partial [Molorchus minor]